MLYLADVVGVQEKFRGSATEVSGVRVIDELTLEIEIKEPIEFFLAELTYPVAYVVDQRQIEQNPSAWTRNPNGTGPFRLAEFQPAELIRLIKNDRYHLGAPKLNEIVFELAGGSIVTRYQNDDLHIGAVPGIEIEAVKSGTSPLSEDYEPRSRMAVSYMAFNIAQPPFDDINVRKAFALSVDRATINTVLLYDTQRIADGILPPEMPGYTESVQGYDYDPDEARRLLSESKYAGDFPRIILTYPGTGGDSPDTLQAIQAGWKETLGLDVELQASEYSAFLRELRRGTFQMFSTGWAADYPDPEDFLDKLFNTDSAQNEQGYSNPEVDSLLADARVEMNQERRYQLYAEAEQLILDDYAIIPTYWPTEHLLVKPCVQNWPENLPMSVPIYRYLEIRDE
jgi:ABC-type transport system substrate-binding protein